MKFRAMMAAWDCVLIVRRRYRTVSIHHAIYASIRDHGYVLGAADALSGVAR